MKQITLFLFACVLFALPFSSVSAQKIEGTIKVFSEGTLELMPNTDNKFSYTKFGTEKLKEGKVTVITPSDMFYWSLYFSTAKVGKYNFSSPHIAKSDGNELPADYAAMSYFSFESVPALGGSNDKEYNDYVQTACKENNIPMNYQLEITKSENGKISGTFTCVLLNSDCSSFMVDCVMVIKGSFTDLNVN